MTFEELNDDIALPVKPYKVIACLAVNGRLPLLKHTIERLYKKNGCYKVICSGDLPEDRKLCESLDAVWVQARNKPLGNKWNQSFYKAREFNPDAVLFVGSSDFVSDNWFSIMKPYVDTYGFAGVPGSYLTDVGNDLRLCDWTCGYAGYRSDRADECIGVGRMLSRRLLDAINWLPFDPQFDNSLDRSMKDNGIVKGYDDFMVKDTRLKALSLSTPLWKNKHVFEMHWNNMIPSIKMTNPEMWLQENFPEVLELHDTLKPLILAMQSNK